MKSFVLLFSCCMMMISLSAQSALQKSIDAWVKDASLQYGSASVCVIDVQTGKLIAGHDSNRGLIPASSMKIIVTSTALQVLGEDFRFKTELQYDGTIDNGVLKGNIYIKGYGDPSLGSDHYEKADNLETVMNALVEAIQQAGIRKIEGKIIGDASFLGTEVSGRTWLWEDLGNYYGAGAWGLNIHENRYFIKLQQQSRLGSRPSVASTEPTIPNLLLLNELKSAKKGSGDNAYVFGTPYSYTNFIRGTIPVGKGLFTIKGAIPDPPFFVAYYLMKKLESAGIETRKIATSEFELERKGESNLAMTRRTIIYTHQSPVLVDLIRETNHKSINLYCEALLRYLGKEVKGEGSPDAGLEVTLDFWEKKGIDRKGFFLADGSGLSPFNTVSTFQLSRVLEIIAKDKSWYNSFRQSLPLAGKTGSVRYMFKNTIAENNLRAKSGGMKRVRSYTGYAKDASGRLLAFSIIANHFTGKSNKMRAKMEKVMLAVCKNR